MQHSVTLKSGRGQTMHNLPPPDFRRWGGGWPPAPCSDITGRWPCVCVSPWKSWVILHNYNRRCGVRGQGTGHNMGRKLCPPTPFFLRVDVSWTPLSKILYLPLNRKIGWLLTQVHRIMELIINYKLIIWNDEFVIIYFIIGPISCGSL